MAEMDIQGVHAYRSRADSVELFQPFLGLDPEEFKELAGKVLIAIPHRPSEGINRRLFNNAGIWAILGTPVASVQDEFTGFVEMTRAGIVRTFLSYSRDHPAIEYLVMIDNDEAVEWDAPYKLAQWGKDVVSGIVCSFSEKKGGLFACVTVNDSHGIARFPSLSRTKRLPGQGLVEIHSCGAGLLCIHKRVLEAMIDKDDSPFMIPEEIRAHCCSTGVLKLGEDMAFSKRCLDYGFKIYVDFSVRAIHYKLLEVKWPDAAIDFKLSARDWRVADDDFTQPS